MTEKGLKVSPLIFEPIRTSYSGGNRVRVPVLKGMRGVYGYGRLYTMHTGED